MVEQAVAALADLAESINPKRGHRPGAPALVRLTLTVLVGTPGAAARAAAADIAAARTPVLPVLDVDQLRLEHSATGDPHDPAAALPALERLRARVDHHLARGRSVVVNATAATARERTTLLGIAHRAGAGAIAVAVPPGPGVGELITEGWDAVLMHRTHAPRRRSGRPSTGPAGGAR